MKALAFLADEVFGGYADVVQEDRRVWRPAETHLALMATEADARHFLRLENECADAVRAGAVAGARHQDDVVGGNAVAAPLFPAVDDVAVAVLASPRIEGGDVRSRLGLGNCDSRDDAALGNDRQESFALLF